MTKRLGWSFFPLKVRSLLRWSGRAERAFSIRRRRRPLLKNFPALWAGKFFVFYSINLYCKLEAETIEDEMKRAQSQAALYFISRISLRPIPPAMTWGGVGGFDQIQSS